MKLFASPFSCSQAAHLALRATELAFEVVWVDLTKTSLPDGSDYLAVASKGKVPALLRDDGEVLTEVAAVLQYIADLAPNAGLAPPQDDVRRYRIQETLSFIGTEIHKQIFYPLLNAQKTADNISADELRGFVLSLLPTQLNTLVKMLGNKAFINGEAFGIADAYLVVILNWVRFVNYRLDRWPTLEAYRNRLLELPLVQETLAIERRIPNAYSALRPGML